MMRRLQRIGIGLGSSFLLGIIPVFSTYVLLPLATILVAKTQNIEQSWALFIYIMQSLLTLLSLLWHLAHLHIWIDSDGEEALRASDKKTYSNMPDVLLLFVIYQIMTLPAFLVGSFYYPFVWFEYLRFFAVTLFLAAGLYLLALLLRSVTMALVIIYAYAFFSISFSSKPEFSSLALLKPDAEIYWEELSAVYLWLIPVAVLLLVAGHLIEKKFYRLR